MAGFQNRFKQFQQITNDCLQYALDCKYLSIKVTNRDILYTDKSFNDAINLASKLPKIFTQDIINTYYTFGIKGL